jgi:hypothetical protein
MTIDEAIYVQGVILAGKERAGYTREVAALQLGIEALRRIRRQRIAITTGVSPLLPGETP